MSTDRRDSDSKRHSSSKYDRLPSPKRSRRDDSEKGRRNDDGDISRGRDFDHKRLPLEVPSRKAEDAVLSKGSEKKTDQLDDYDQNKLSEKKESGSQTEKKHSSDPAEIPKSRSHNQHDDRGSTSRYNCSSDQRPSSDRAWINDSRDQLVDREASRYKRSHTGDDIAAERGNRDRSRRHDKFFELEANPPQPASRKRPAFSDRRLQLRMLKKNCQTKVRGTREVVESPDIWKETGVRRPYNGDRGITNRGEHQGFGPSSRDRFAGSTGNNRTRDGMYGRQGHQATALSDKWKHDMFSEANRSPTPKNEEEQIAKVEALLAS